MCNLVEYSHALPIEYQVCELKLIDDRFCFHEKQIFDSLPNVTDQNELARYGGHVMLADYCPYNQELAYKNSNRDSRCYLSDNQPPRKDDFDWIYFSRIFCFRK